ncbi:armadillo-type protein [Russula ochroleuca]|uniref:AP complex subunit beta n=1 Tax=Russula ochroleuca TaxID=152965 RepID=A0A9P5N5M1_9AGAM|nr:armadillo-type protein [Russula ochroleuca]
MISDSDPMVIANTISTLADIHTSAASQPSTSLSDPAIFTVAPTVLNKLLIALNECSEWGRVVILPALARYQAQDGKEREHIFERVVPQFQHVNGSVVLAAVRVFMIHMRHVPREDFNKQLIRTMEPPLVKLLSSLQSLQLDARLFLGPSGRQSERLDIMVRLSNENNVDALLSELKVYTPEVHVDFVRRSIKVTEKAAVNIDAEAERCVNVLLDLIATRVSYVVQEAVVVMKDISAARSKASLIWIVGEYANKIENADELLSVFVDTFTEESYSVQLQTLTAVVKLFLYKPDSSQQRILNTATKDCESPDVRDRAYIYWRLLSTDPGAAKSVILAHRPPISLPRTTLAPALLNELIGEISSLASVYQKPAATFIFLGRIGVESMQHRGTDLADSVKTALHTVAAGQAAENKLDFDDEPAQERPTGLAATQVPQQPAAKMSGTSTNPLDDLVSIFGRASSSAPISSVDASAIDPLGGFGAVSSATAAPSTPSNQ